jgi:hypothetical protein
MNKTRVSHTPDIEARDILLLLIGRLKSETEKSSFNIHSSYRSIRTRLNKTSKVVVFINMQFSTLPLLLRTFSKKSKEEREQHF